MMQTVQYELHVWSVCSTRRRHAWQRVPFARTGTASDSHLQDVLEGTVDGGPDGLALVVGDDLVTDAGEVLTVQAEFLVHL